jgi:tol-pal system protein YbgF
MRTRYLLPLLLLASASAPALAQRASLSDRVAALEARAANNQANVDLLNQVGQLRSEIQALRAQVEELQQLNQQLQSTSKAQYLDVDDRLNRLEGTGPAAGASGAPAPPVNKPAPATPAVPKGAAAESTPSVYGDKGAIAQGAGERAAYEAAFNALKAGQYVQSAELFQDFLQQYPNGSYTPNALYWLGESYYVTQNYPLAQEQFQALLDRYPTHDKAPGALLKVGLSQYGAREYDAAERTLSEVASRYPGTDAARTAADRLSAIQLGQLRR